MEDAALFELFQRLGLALGIGFLVGVERGWKKKDAKEGSRAAGLRTHAIIGLFGGVAGALLPTIGPIGFAALTLAFAIAFIDAKRRETEFDHDLSVTGTISGLVLFALGAFAVLGDMRAAAAAGVALTAMLAFKEALHEWLDRVSWPEIRSALLILAATAIALPLLPDEPVDPWGLLNPRELWMLTILVGVISFGGYVAVRLLGDRAGLIAGALAGALVSSTLVTVEMGRRVKKNEVAAPAGAGAAAWAGAVSLCRVLILALAAVMPVVPVIWGPLVAGVLAYVAAGLLLFRRDRGGESQTAHAYQNPLSLSQVAKFAGLLAVIIVLGRLASRFWGDAGLLPFAATAGIADVDAVTLAVGSLVRGDVAPASGAAAVLLAVVVNALSKGVLAIASGGWRYAAGYFLATGAAFLAGGAVWLFFSGMLLPI